MTISRMQQPRQMYQDGSIMPRLNELGSGVSSAEQMLQGINQRLESAESNLGEGSAMQQPFLQQPMSPLENAMFDKDGFRLGDQRYGTGFGQQPQYGLDQPPQMALPENPMSGGPMQSPLASAMRNMAADGGLMGRQNYGLGSLVKSITKGVKKIVKSPIGKAALLGIGAFGLPGAAGQSIFSGFAPQALKTGASNFIFGGGTKYAPALDFKQAATTNPNIFGKIKNFFGGEKTFGKTAAMFGIGSLGGTAIAALEAAGLDTDNPNAMPRDVEALKIQLANGYRTLNPGVGQDEVDAFVQANTAEYRADGGRIGYAFGKNPEENAMRASGLMNLPLNQNPAGVTELDLRDTGGFIPPVGVKEKEDDIPAMLSNNEFVFTADAVRGMGDGDVNKGAQRMYDMMKKLEGGGRV